MTPRTVVHLVPHTHWDREWYLPFQTFRMRLVALVDGLLDEMARDERVRFTLDGQTATVKDYLDVRPERRDELAQLVRGGRLSIGPWHILMDEFLVSGETIVRNLELGMRTAAGLGGVMRVGYLPDMFGHIAQMPQILRRAGIGDAVVWRGVPAAIDRHVFVWVAPDGSTVRCEYLLGGYGNARDLFDDPEAIESRLEAFLALVAHSFGADDILAMYGEDHSVPAPGYASTAAYFERGQARYSIAIETLDKYLSATRGRSRPTTTWTGELRSGARANVLMGVTSHRSDVKAAAALAERTLERGAEPLLALHGSAWPDRYLELAWRKVIENSAHDSICACSADEVVDQVLVRFAEATQIGQGLTDGALSDLAGRLPAGSWLVVNPSPTERTDLVELNLDETAPTDAVEALGVRLPSGEAVPVQELSRTETVLDDVVLDAAEVAGYLRTRIHGRELYRTYLSDWSLSDGDRVVLLLRGTPEDRSASFDTAAMLAALEARAAAATEARWRLRVEQLTRRRFLARVPVPALGWIAVRPELLARGRPTPLEDAVRVGADTLDNGRVRVEVAADGTLTIDGGDSRLSGVGRLVDGGDAGDAYNYGPPPRDLLVDAPEDVNVEVAEAGLLRGTILVHRDYQWPAGLVADLTERSNEVLGVRVTTAVTLLAGEPFVRLHIGFDNPSRDHRLRFHIPLPRPVTASFAEGQFAIVERGLTMEGGHGEHPTPTFPAHGFVGVEGVTALLMSVTEYEVVDGRELALTMLRATGLTSRDVHPWRADPAGPALATPGAQALGPRGLEFALLPAASVPGPATLAALERYRYPFIAMAASGATDAELGRADGLSITGDGIVLSALRRRDGALELRIVNETPDERTATVRGPFRKAVLRDLLGGPLSDLAVHDGQLGLTLGAWEIMTVWLLA